MLTAQVSHFQSKAHQQGLDPGRYSSRLEVLDKQQWLDVRQSCIRIADYCFRAVDKTDRPDTATTSDCGRTRQPITANVIAHCTKHRIDLLTLPPGTSPVLQPLGVSVFLPLKRALAVETDSASRLDAGRIQRSEWTSMYIRARKTALTSSSILSGFKATGLWSLSPIEVLEKLPTTPACQASELHNTTTPLGLDLSLLQGDPPDGKELCKANALYLTAV